MNFQGLLLAGGEGTRLRPLTRQVPKPVIPLVNRPFLHYQLDLLSRAGITKASLLSGFGASRIRAALGSHARGVDLDFIEEKEPLGTGGAVGNAGRLLRAPAVVTNGDVLTDLDIADALRFHREKGGLGTLVLHPVADPRRYGVVLTDASGKIRQFMEKPEHPPSNLINAGFYLLEPEFFDLIAAGPSSIERDIFPRILETGGALFAYVHRGYWLDIGTIESYRRATRDLLDGALPAFHAEAVRRRIQSALPDSASADAFSVIGPRCVVSGGARIEDSVLFGESALGADCRIRGSILGFGCRVAPGARVEDAVLVPSVPTGTEGTEGA